MYIYIYIYIPLAASPTIIPNPPLPRLDWSHVHLCFRSAAHAWLPRGPRVKTKTNANPHPSPLRQPPALPLTTTSTRVNSGFNPMSTG